MSGGLDQVFSSVSNGVSIFAVAVAASPEAFGQITILTTVLFALLQCSRGGLGIPLLQAANQHPEDILSEGSRALGAVLAISPLLGLAIFAFYPVVGFSAIAIGLSVPIVLGQDIIRYVAMTIGRPHVAAIWDGVWALGAVVTLVLAWLSLPFVTAGFVLATWGALGLIALVAMAVDLRMTPYFRGVAGWLRANWRDRVNYAIDAGLEQGALVIIFSAMSVLMTADSAGALRGAMALFAPIGIFGVAVQMVLIPESVRASASPARVWRLLAPTAVLTGLVTAAIGAVAYFLPPSIGFYLLGDSWESAHKAMIPTTAWFVAACFAVVIGLQLKTFNRSRELLAMKVSSSIVQLLVAIGAALWIGTPAGVAACLAAATFLAALFFFFRWPPARLEPRLDAPAETEVGLDEAVLTTDLPMVFEGAPPGEETAGTAVHTLADPTAQPDPPPVRVERPTPPRRRLMIGIVAAACCLVGMLILAQHINGRRRSLRTSTIDLEP